MKDLDDVQLVKLFAAGSSEAFEVLLSRYGKQLYGYMMSMVKHAHIADDVFQETCIKVMATLKRGGYKDSGKFIAWMMRVAHNQVIDYFRQQRNDSMLVADEFEWDLLSQNAARRDGREGQPMSELEATELRRLICYLPSEQREVLVMRYYMNMTHKEVAEKLNIGLNTALGRMRYAITNLQKMVEKNKNSALRNNRVQSAA